MPVKFTRDSISGAHHAPANRYEIRPGQSGPPARRRLLFIYVALIVLAGASIVVHFLSTNRINRWLPERPGTAVVVEKLPATDESPRYRLRIRVEVPAATPDEAALLPDEYPDRATALGPQELDDIVETPEADWASVEPGTRLRASYQLNIPRSKVVVRALYLDHLDKAVDPESALP